MEGQFCLDRLSEPDVTYRVRGVKETKVAGQENDDPTRISISLLAKLRVTSMQSEAKYKRLDCQRLRIP